MGLTGRFNFRRTLTGKVVLLVEEDVVPRLVRRGRARRRWRDATVMDLTNPMLRGMLDLRERLPYVPSSPSVQPHPPGEAAGSQEVRLPHTEPQPRITSH